MIRALFLLLLLAGSAHAEAVISLPATGPTITQVGQRFLIPLTVTEWTNPTGLGAHWVEVNVQPSQGLTIEHALVIGPWTISGNPTYYYGWHNYYVDNFQMCASFINGQTPPCIIQTEGVAFSLWVQVNEFWTGGPETLTLGKSIKETKSEPRLLDCGLAEVPIRYGISTCVFPIVTGEPPSGGGSGTCHSVYCETAVTKTVKTSWARVKQMYR